MWRHFAVDVVHRRTSRQLTVRVTEVIDRAKQLRAFLYQLYIGLPDFICKLLAHPVSYTHLSLADTAGIVLVEDAVLDADAKARAEQQEIAVYGTSLPAFETALKIASLLG